MTRHRGGLARLALAGLIAAGVAACGKKTDNSTNSAWENPPSLNSGFFSNGTADGASGGGGDTRGAVASTGVASAADLATKLEGKEIDLSLVEPWGYAPTGGFSCAGASGPSPGYSEICMAIIEDRQQGGQKATLSVVYFDQDGAAERMTGFFRQGLGQGLETMSTNVNMTSKSGAPRGKKPMACETSPDTPQRGVYCVAELTPQIAVVATTPFPADRDPHAISQEVFTRTANLAMSGLLFADTDAGLTPRSAGD